MRAGAEFTVSELQNKFVTSSLVMGGLGVSLPLKKDKVSLIILRAIMYIENKEFGWRFLVWLLKWMRKNRNAKRQ